MAKTKPALTLGSSRDIPFDMLVLSQSNVRRVKAGVSIEELAEDIARRTLRQSLTARPVLDEAGHPTGIFERPAGDRRYRALELAPESGRAASPSSAAAPPAIRQEANIAATTNLIWSNKELCARTYWRTGSRTGATGVSG